VHQLDAALFEGVESHISNARREAPGREDVNQAASRIVQEATERD
jgi:hypothetical protein